MAPTSRKLMPTKAIARDVAVPLMPELSVHFAIVPVALRAARSHA